MPFTPLEYTGGDTYKVGVTHLPTERGFDVTFTNNGENTEAEIDGMLQEFIDHVSTHPNWTVTIGYKTAVYSGTFTTTPTS